MGGVFILGGLLLGILLWGDFSNFYVWILMGVMVFFGGIGFIDDYIKLIKRISGGFRSCDKFLL